MKYILLIITITNGLKITAQNQTYWQQKVNYIMHIDMNVQTHRFTGEQQLTYYNNSPDTLKKVYYHLYFNAFQPGSMMDIRSRTIADPDRRVGDRIATLSDSEIGYHHITSLKQNGKRVTYAVHGTILEVGLNKPIPPGEKATFDMIFNSQVPLQIRRSGRDNAEGISYSMSQWYPKMAEYDNAGWHTNPYIGREFHGVWGDFEVKITIDSAYILGGTGYLQNGDEIGYGYGKDPESRNEKLTWHFKAPNVHDFVWAADPDYKHVVREIKDGPTLHFLYQATPSDNEPWEELPQYMEKAMAYMNDNFGRYPYEQYSFIQGGDGGMEYPMATLITGNRQFESLLGVSVHEMIHSWYQGVLATNESLYAWMDEGFTSYASELTMNYLSGADGKSLHSSSYRNYFFMAGSGEEEPLTTHADHYRTNRSYGINAYSKGAVFLGQLDYITGHKTFMKGMRRYFNEWKFKHPTPIDLIRAMEKEADMQLDWYAEHFVNSTNQIDYGIKAVLGMGDKTFVTLERHGDMIMPIDLHITYNNGMKEIHYIPLRIMLGSKAVEDWETQRQTHEAWPWTYPTYTLQVNDSVQNIKTVEIDETGRMADIDRNNNKIMIEELVKAFSDPTK